MVPPQLKTSQRSGFFVSTHAGNFSVQMLVLSGTMTADDGGAFQKREMTGPWTCFLSPDKLRAL